MRDALLPLMMAAMALLIVGLAGRCDREAEELQFAHYCEMVLSGAWPDYDNALKYCNREGTLGR